MKAKRTDNKQQLDLFEDTVTTWRDATATLRGALKRGGWSRAEMDAVLTAFRCVGVSRPAPAPVVPAAPPVVAAETPAPPSVVAAEEEMAAELAEWREDVDAYAACDEGVGSEDYTPDPEEVG